MERDINDGLCSCLCLCSCSGREIVRLQAVPKRKWVGLAGIRLRNGNGAVPPAEINVACRRGSATYECGWRVCMYLHGIPTRYVCVRLWTGRSVDRWCRAERRTATTVEFPRASARAYEHRQPPHETQTGRAVHTYRKRGVQGHLCMHDLMMQACSSGVCSVHSHSRSSSTPGLPPTQQPGGRRHHMLDRHFHARQTLSIRGAMGWSRWLVTCRLCLDRRLA